MALAYLAIVFAALIVIAVILQILLYKSNKESSKGKFIFVLNMLLGVLLSFLAYTALPSNYIGWKVLAAFWSILAILGIIIVLKSKQSPIIGKVILTASVLGGLIQLMLF